MRLRDPTSAPAFQRAARVLAAEDLRVPPDADDVAMETCRTQLEAALTKVTKLAYAIVGREDSHG